MLSAVIKQLCPFFSSGPFFIYDVIKVWEPVMDLLSVMPSLSSGLVLMLCFCSSCYIISYFQTYLLFLTYHVVVFSSFHECNKTVSHHVHGAGGGGGQWRGLQPPFQRVSCHETLRMNKMGKITKHIVSFHHFTLVYYLHCHTFPNPPWSLSNVR